MTGPGVWKGKNIETERGTGTRPRVQGYGKGKDKWIITGIRTGTKKGTVTSKG